MTISNRRLGFITGITATIACVAISLVMGAGRGLAASSVTPPVVQAVAEAINPVGPITKGPDVSRRPIITAACKGLYASCAYGYECCSRVCVGTDRRRNIRVGNCGRL